MAEPVVPSIVGAGVGALSVPALTAVGLDPAALIAGLIGCVIAQTLLPAAQPDSVKKIIGLTIGSILFASLMTPVFAPWVVHHVTQYVSETPPQAVRAIVAAALGGFAQPLLTWMIAQSRKRFNKMKDKGEK